MLVIFHLKDGNISKHMANYFPKGIVLHNVDIVQAPYVLKYYFVFEVSEEDATMLVLNGFELCGPEDMGIGIDQKWIDILKEGGLQIESYVDRLGPLERILKRRLKR
jgi:hypothetical protein